MMCGNKLNKVLFLLPLNMEKIYLKQMFSSLHGNISERQPSFFVIPGLLFLVVQGKDGGGWVDSGHHSASSINKRHLSRSLEGLFEVLLLESTGGGQ